jgi:hypothetical protein
MSRKRVIATLAAASVVIVLVAGAAIAPAGVASSSHANQLAGTWIVTARPQAPSPPITVYQAWTSDGTYLSYSGNGTLGDSPAGRSHEFGSWERIEGRLYASSGAFLRFNTQTGALVGSTRINRTLRLSEDGQSFTAIGRVSILDLGGNVVASFLVPSSGERLQVEHITEEP